MRKHILVILSILICSMSMTFVDAKATNSPALNSAIKLYKAKNYSESYVALKNIVKKDPSNALAYYYLAMSSAQIGKKSEAIENYQTVINLSPNDMIGKYAAKGKLCLEEPSRCHETSSNGMVSSEEAFIRGSYGSGFSDQVRSDYEKHKIENLMREMNRNNDIQPNKFKDYRDFSSELPTNDEIVAALRTLQRAGLADFVSGNNMSDLALLTGNGYNAQNAMLNLLNGSNNSSINPQVLQSLLTNQMSIGF